MISVATSLTSWTISLAVLRASDSISLPAASAPLITASFAREAHRTKSPLAMRFSHVLGLLLGFEIWATSWNRPRTASNGTVWPGLAASLILRAAVGLYARYSDSKSTSQRHPPAADASGADENRSTVYPAHFASENNPSLGLHHR